MKEKKIFIIGLDGATWKLIDPLIAKGKLPTFRKLIKNGTRGILESTLLPVSPAAWTSFATGRRPDKHGIFDFAHREKATYDSVPYSSLDRKCETLWNILGKKNKRSIVLNVPCTYPPEKVKGLMVSGFPTPEELGDFTYPSKLLNELRGKFGKDFRFQPRVNAQNEGPFLEEMHTVTDYVYKATDYLMKKYPWDFLMTVFVGPDALGHVFYKYMDPTHPLHKEKSPEKYKNAVYDMYEKIDGYMAALLENIDPDTTVFLMSDHGFGPIHYGVSINNWLVDEGFLVLKKDLSTRFRRRLFRMGVNYSNLFRLIKALGLMKHAAKQAYSKKSRLSAFVNKFFLTVNDIDWKRTTAYCMGNGGQLYINLKGREPLGIVEAGKEYHGLVEKVIRRLGKLKDPNNGEVMFDEAYRKKDVFPAAGETDIVPDIVFFNRNMRYSINRFFEFGSKHLLSPHPMWNGTHTHDGIFLANEPGQVRKGERIENATIQDITPTILHMMNAPLSRDMDGKILMDIFEKDSKFKKSKTEYTDMEKERIQEMIGTLKGLGRL